MEKKQADLVGRRYRIARGRPQRSEYVIPFPHAVQRCSPCSGSPVFVPGRTLVSIYTDSSETHVRYGSQEAKCENWPSTSRWIVWVDAQTCAGRGYYRTFVNPPDQPTDVRVVNFGQVIGTKEADTCSRSGVIHHLASQSLGRERLGGGQDGGRRRCQESDIRRGSHRHSQRTIDVGVSALSYFDQQPERLGLTIQCARGLLHGYSRLLERCNKPSAPPQRSENV
ncbi:unnamed protein product [Nesidiocoris tenuis]|uniref:Uncharacterized protein n=1 Tax=Nesidiocoris tenuis TaxID=355587 RepID=A0A6H5G2U2_9HEMI|nr:unnamed protein product [Nesidiocoris tenuis]